jgi:hypothetical protein
LGKAALHYAFSLKQMPIMKFSQHSSTPPHARAVKILSSSAFKPAIHQVDQTHELVDQIEDELRTLAP